MANVRSFIDNSCNVFRSYTELNLIKIVHTEFLKEEWCVCFHTAATPKF